MAEMFRTSCGADYRWECVSHCPRCHRLAREHCCSGCASSSSSAARGVGHNQSGGMAVRWLHIPKCGSTLAISLLAYACTPAHPTWHIVFMAVAGGSIDVRMAHAIDSRHATTGTRCEGRIWLPFHGHDPVRAEDELIAGPGGALTHAAALSARGGGLVAMFRRPSQRIISAFLDNYHAWGIATHTNRARMKEQAPTVDLWARFPGVAACQTKMLAGLKCGDRFPTGHGSRLLAKAIRLLRSKAFIFVGLVEEWNSSICLLHATLGRGTQPILGEFQSFGHSRNSRRIAAGGDASGASCRLRSNKGTCFDRVARRGEYNESVLGGWRDELDEALYAVAVEVYRANLARYEERIHGGV